MLATSASRTRAGARVNDRKTKPREDFTPNRPYGAVRSFTLDFFFFRNFQ
jgi:hypothetical protein